MLEFGQKLGKEVSTLTKEWKPSKVISTKSFLFLPWAKMTAKQQEILGELELNPRAIQIGKGGEGLGMSRSW
jgi:hypothetical protein